MNRKVDLRSRWFLLNKIHDVSVSCQCAFLAWQLVTFIRKKIYVRIKNERHEFIWGFLDCIWGCYSKRFTQYSHQFSINIHSSVPESFVFRKPKSFSKKFSLKPLIRTKKLNDWKTEFRLREIKMKLDFSRNWVFMSPGPKDNIFESPIIDFSLMTTFKTHWRLFEYSKTAETSLDRAGQFGKSSHTICMPVAFWAFSWQNPVLATKKVTSATSVNSYICKQKRFVFEVFSFWDFWLSCCYSLLESTPTR